MYDEISEKPSRSSRPLLRWLRPALLATIAILLVAGVILILKYNDWFLPPEKILRSSPN